MLKKNKSVVCVIPARLASHRFPRKVLAPLAGKPLIQWVYEKAKTISLFDRVVLAVDAEELYEAATNFGAECFYTSIDCTSGTERLVELRETKKVAADIWVNWQADEPFITEEAIADLLQSANEPIAGIWTLKKKISQEKEILSPNVVKVVCDFSKKALYFSRSPIPYGQKNIYKHIGLYAFSDEALGKTATLSPCALEQQERLEQLRFLYHGMPIVVHETSQEIFGIDTKEELAIAQQMCYHFTNS